MIKKFAWMLPLAILCGCTSNKVLLVVPQQDLQRLAAPGNAIRPCGLTKDERMKYSGVEVMSAPRIVIPQKAKDERVDGCASAEFQIDKDGAPYNVRLVKENPTGYGFGDEVLRHLKATRFKPDTEDKWHYKASGFISSTMHQTKTDKTDK